MGLKYPTGGRQTSWLAIYKNDRGVELGSTEKQLQLSGNKLCMYVCLYVAGLDPRPATSSHSICSFWNH